MLIGGIASALLAGSAMATATPVSAAPGDFAWGVVTVDANQNGTLDSGPQGEADRGLAGVKVEIVDATDAVLDDTTTAADGSWAIADEPSGGEGPYRVRINTSGANGNVYATYPTASGANDFARSGRPNLAVAELPSDGELNALVYPAWKLDPQLAADPDGVGGRSILTGTPLFDANDTGAGNDSGADNARVRSADIVAFNWTLTAENEDGSLGDSFENAVFEQTVGLVNGAVANFASIPAICGAGSGIVELPSGNEIPAQIDPSPGTTSVVLTCVLGEMGTSPSPSAYILSTQVQPSSKSPNGSAFSTTSRFYAVDDDGVATAQPATGPDVPPIEITAAPRYDVEKINGDASGNYIGSYHGEPGTYSYYTVQISTDRVVGVEAFQQPLTLEESFWALIPPPSGDGSQLSNLRWYVTQCIPSPAPRSGQVPGGLVFGRVGSGSGIATEANSVRDSGTCTIGSRTVADTGSYQLSLDGIDTSGLSYPTQTVAGASLTSGPYYVASYRIQIFIPASELDRADGVPGDGYGSMSVYNRVGGFDPVGVSGAENHGGDGEPGYCDAGEPSDLSEKCRELEDGSRSNNVAGPHTKQIHPGSWGKYFLNLSTGWAGGYGQLPDVMTSHDGAGQVQPGQAFTSSQFLHNTSTVAMADVQLCDVFDNTMLKLVPLNHDVSGSNPFADELYSAVLKRVDDSRLPPAESKADQVNWVVEYGVTDLTGDDPNLGTFDVVNNRWQGDWTRQRAATNGANTVCGDPAMTWYADPADVPGGVDAVNVVRLSAAPRHVLAPNSSAVWLLAFEQRDAYRGGPHAGQAIPAGTIATNFGAVKSSTYHPGWSAASYIPGAGTTAGGSPTGESSSTQGDRWTVTRALLRLQKRTVAVEVDGRRSSGASDYGVTGATVAGRPVVWEINAAITAASDDPAPVQNVIITDTLPRYVSYDDAATAALPSGTPASSFTVNDDGTTTLVWNLGILTPNAPSPGDPENLNGGVPQLRIVTFTDPLSPPNTVAVNTATITADDVVPVRAHTDTHTVRIEQSGQVQLKKSVDRVLDLQDDNQQYTLQLKNFSESLVIQSPTIIDVLPYNGDATNAAKVNRTPGSDFAGTSRLNGPPQAFEFDGTTPLDGTFHYTTVDGEDVPQSNQHDTDPAIWSTTFTPAATAFKFVAAGPLATTKDLSKSGIEIRVRTDQAANAAGDLYTNRFTAHSPTLNEGNQLLTSNTVSVRVLGFTLGDLIWIDVDGDGRYTEGTDQVAPEGVRVEVYDKADVKVGDTVTDADGRWLVSRLPRGGYYAVIPAAEFASGGLLEGHLPAPHPVGDPNSDQNEEADHHAIAGVAGAVRSSGLIELDADVAADPIAGLEPLGDNVAGLVLPPLTGDDFTNLTLDLALTPPSGQAQFTVVKRVVGATDVEAYDFEVRCYHPATGDGGVARVEYPVPAEDARFSLKADQERTITVPAGVTCAVTEVNIPADATVEVLDSDDSTEGGVGDGILADLTGTEERVEVTNTFDIPELPITDPPGPTDPELPFTGANAAWVLGLAALALIAGIVLVMVRARRT